MDLQLYVMAFKNSAFSEESEWRAVCRVDYLSGIADLEFRASAQEVVPLFTLSPDKGILLPIDSVMVGPRTSPDASEEAVRLLLWKFGYNNFKVTSSQIPLRS